MVRKGRTKRGEAIEADLKRLCDTLERGEPLEDKFTVRTVELNLNPPVYKANDVKVVRDSLNVSQAVFAKILATSVECVEGWEQGVRRIPPMACRLLDLVQSSKHHWVRVLKKAKKTSAHTYTAR